MGFYLYCLLLRIKNTYISPQVEEQEYGGTVMKQLAIEFKSFIDEYKIVGLAVAFVIGQSATTLIKAIVDNIIMPLITPFIPGGEWATAKLHIWKFSLGWGPALSAIINFAIIAVVVFMIAKFLFKEEKVTKR